MFNQSLKLLIVDAKQVVSAWEAICLSLAVLDAYVK